MTGPEQVMDATERAAWEAVAPPTPAELDAMLRDSRTVRRQQMPEPWRTPEPTQLAPA